MTDNISSPAIISQVSKTPDLPSQNGGYNYGDGSGKTTDQTATMSDPLPDFGKGSPFGYKIIVEPVGIDRVSKGGIILTDQSVDAKYWNHGIARVVAVGPCSWLGSIWQQFKSVFSDLQKIPEVGDPILFQAKDGIRFQYGNHTCILLNDSNVQMVIDPDTIGRFKFGSL